MLFRSTAPENAFAPEAKEHLLRLRAGKDDARALKLFEEKNYAEAITAWEAAYQISAQPVFLFRIAEAQRLRGDKKVALAGYERFLKETPPGELRELRQQAEEQSLAIKTGTEIGRSKPVYKRAWFWAVLDSVGVAAIAGLSFGAFVGSATQADVKADIRQ